MSHILILGMGYTASRLAAHLQSKGWKVTGTRREASNGSIALANEAMVMEAIARATHILSSVPPTKDGHDPVLNRYAEAIANTELQWSGYLSSTGVYGDVAGAWVDETAPTGLGRRKARSEADLRWQVLREDMRVFRLPGIYGPQRSALDRIKAEKAKRIDLPKQIFSRIHVDDIISAVIASFDGPAGVYNIADSQPASQQEVIAYAARLLGKEPPPLLSMKDAKLSETARAFYDENRRIANGKAKRLLNWKPRYPSYKSGLAALLDR